jgi:hypothetical protein
MDLYYEGNAALMNRAGEFLDGCAKPSDANTRAVARERRRIAAAADTCRAVARALLTIGRRKADRQRLGLGNVIQFRKGA